MNNDANKYITEWRDTILEAANAFIKKDTDGYNSLIDKSKELYEQYLSDSKLYYECNNFGMANHVFESALPTLLKSNKKAIKEFIETIKGDDNLSNQFKFLKSLEGYNENLDSKVYIEESLKLAKDGIDSKSINESNSKLYDIIKKYGIKASDEIPSDKLKLYEDCDFLFKNKKSMSNLGEMGLRLKDVAEYTRNNYNSITESKKDVNKLIEDFDRKYNAILTESEKNLVKDIMSVKNGENSEKKEKLFNKFKNECILVIDKLLSESDEHEKNELLSIKEQINSKEFNEDTLIADMAKLLEIRDILVS